MRYSDSNSKRTATQTADKTFIKKNDIYFCVALNGNLNPDKVSIDD